MNQPRTDNFQKKEEYYVVNLNKKRAGIISGVFVLIAVFVFLTGYWAGRSASGETFHVPQGISESYLYQTTPSQVHQDHQALTVQTKQGTAPSIDEDLLEDDILDDTVNDEMQPSQKTVSSSLSPESPKKNVSVPKTLTKPEKPKHPASKSIAKTRRTTKKFPQSKRTKNISSHRRKGVYKIQVIACKTRKKADKIVRELRNLGFSAYVIKKTVKGNTYYRVRVGNFSTKKEAKKVLTKLQRTKYGRDVLLVKSRG